MLRSLKLCLSVLLAFSTGVLFADDEKADQPSPRIRVLTEDGPFVFRRVVTEEEEKRINEILKETGLEGKKLEEAAQRMVELLQKRRNAILPQVQMKAVVVGPDGKSHVVELERPGKGAEEPKKPILALPPQFDSAKIWAEIEKGLQQSGLSEEQLKETRKMFDNAMKLGKGSGRAEGIFIDPKGALRRFEWRNLPQGKAAWALADDDSRYMIGISCVPDAEAAEKEPELKGRGVIIASVFPDTPASQAGLQTDDAIVEVDGEPVEDVKSLVAAVQKAGNKKESLELTYVRGDERKKVKVAPQERKAVWLDAELELERLLPNLPRRELDLPMLPRVGPGIVRGRSTIVTSKELEEVKQQVERLQKELKQLRRELQEDDEDDK